MILRYLTVTIARETSGMLIAVKLHSFALRFGCDLDAKSTESRIRTHDSSRILTPLSLQNRIGLHRNADLNFIEISWTKITLAHETKLCFLWHFTNPYSPLT